MTRIPTIQSPESWPRAVRLHTVTFVRHGEKTGEGFMADLTLHGRRESREVGSRIGCRVDLFLASPSPRAISTAEGIRDGNGSSAPIVQEGQLAEPGLGNYMDFRYAMKSFFTQIIADIKSVHADVVIATTHDYVVRYVAESVGSVPGMTGYLYGITINLEDLEQICELL